MGVYHKQLDHQILSICLDTDDTSSVCISTFFFWEKHFMLFQWVPCTVYGLTNLFFRKIFIKNGTHGIIHTFKNYFATVFSVFSKINRMQTHLESS